MIDCVKKDCLNSRKSSGPDRFRRYHNNGEDQKESREAATATFQAKKLDEYEIRIAGHTRDDSTTQHW